MLITHYRPVGKIGKMWMVNWKLKGEWTLTSQKYENYTTIPEEYLSFLVNASKFGC